MNSYQIHKYKKQMNMKKRLSALLLLGALIFSPSLVGQENEQGKDNTGKEQRFTVGQPVEIPVISVAMMVKEVLGDVYTSVGRSIPESQW